MSKEAMGENGAILGGSAYWKHLNESTVFGALMRDSSTRAYYDTLHATGERANDAVTEVYEDLQENLNSIAGVSSDRRSTLAKRLGALYDVCNMSGVTCHRYGDCIGILELSSRYVPSPDREVENALQMLERSFDFSVSEAVSLLESAVNWGVDRTANGDTKKLRFLQALRQGNGEDFLKTVLDAYNIRSGKVDARGKCGYEIGSSEYLRHLEKQVFLQELPSRLGEDYAKLLREALESIAKQLERDLSTAERENSYITDPTAIVLRSAASELERCNISPRISDDSIDRLAWFVGGDTEKIRQLQRKLNELNIADRLTEDGVYGKKTDSARAHFFEELARGTFPTLAWLDPLQSKATGIQSSLKTTKGGQTFSKLTPVGSDFPLFAADRHPYQGNPDLPHINVKTLPNAPSYQVHLIEKWKLDHKEIPENAYELLKDLPSTKKVVRTSGRILLAAGAVLDALELCSIIDEDLHDADHKLGKKSHTAFADIIGSWAGSAFGAKGGALAGAKIGTLFLPGLGTAIGGITGGFIGGIAGSFGGSYIGSALAEYVVDITNLGE